MRRFPFKKIDAFARGNSGGNPAGCIYLDHEDALTPEQMQAIAAQMKGYVSEVAYLTDRGGMSLKYYSSEREVAFCGHATIAVMYDHIRQNPELLEQKELQIQVGPRQLSVYNEINELDAVFITAPSPVHSSRSWDIDKLSLALGFSRDAISEELPVKLINAGLDSLIVPMSGLEVTLDLNPNFDMLKAYCEEQNIDILEVFTKNTAFPDNAYRTRVFAPRFGYLEDPATGSGNSAFGCYLLELGLWDGGLMSLEQNGSLVNPNRVLLKTILRDEERKVLFGGGALVRIEGEYLVY